jgi:hypothetical protein
VTVTAAEALRMREAVCALFGLPEHEARTAWRSMATCPTVAVDFFLRIERCALALRVRLAEYRLTQETPPALMDIVSAQAMRELQRSLSAQAQLHRIARLVDEHDWKVVVLKGGVTIATGGQVDVQDVDVLMEATDGATLARLLDTSGYTTSHLHPLHHLSPRYTSETVAIEIHQTIPGMPEAQTLMDRAVRIDAIPGLWRLSQADHIWHMLIHATLQHPERRGNLRDVTMLARAVDDCPPEDLAMVLAQIEAHPEAPVLRATIGLARAFRAKQFTADPFAESMLRKYTFCQRYDRRSNQVRERAVRLLSGDRSLVRALREDLALTNEIPSVLGPLNRLNRRVPWLALLIRQGLRLGRLALVAGLAAQNAWDVHRVARRWREA